MNPLPAETGANLIWAPVNMQDASRLLATESIQDQPLGTPVDTQDQPEIEPQGKRTLARFSSCFAGLYSDAVGRCIQRTNKNLETLSPILTPLFSSIATTFEDEARSQFHLPDSWRCSDKIVRDLVKAVSGKASTWTIEQRDAIVAGEMGKTLKTLLYAIYREAGAAIAEGYSNE
jgi:hypothetical protein